MYFKLLLILSSLLAATTVAEVVKFDYSVLSLTWPSSFCKLELDVQGKTTCVDADNVPKRFTIHGLWPTLKNKTVIDPETCSKTKFNVLTMDTKVQARAINNWPDICNSKRGQTPVGFSSSFWGSEWGTHGICSNLDQDAYMNLTLNMYDQVLPSISKTMIKFPHGGTVNINNFTDVLAGWARKKPKLCCKSLNNQQFLSEIHFHLDNSGLPNLIDAGGASNCDTSKPVKFP